MDRLFFSLALILFSLSMYFICLHEESWNVTQYKENRYVDDKGNVNSENMPVVVNKKVSTHDLGYALVIIGSSFFLSGVYLYSRKQIMRM